MRVRARVRVRAFSILSRGGVDSSSMLWLQGQCSPTLAPAKPPWPLNAHTWEGRTSTAEGDFRRFPEHDVRAGLALWLHEIFERQVWELEGDAPRQRRKKALLDFLKLLCGYFPDHLPGQVGDCRESLCHLGWLLADKTPSKRYFSWRFRLVFGCWILWGAMNNLLLRFLNKG